MKSDTFRKTVQKSGYDMPCSGDIRTFQVNIGLRCNQSCSHCHHEAGPEKTEEMSEETMEVVAQKAREFAIPVIDITGGAPELHPYLARFIRMLKANDHHIMVRTNLSALIENGKESFARLYSENGVELIASLPCYSKENVDCIRGEGVFERSITAMQLLNSFGYGVESDLVLNLVYNPAGAVLPPPQSCLKEEYAEALRNDFGVAFTDLFTITNMPMGRFLDDLEANGNKEEYLLLLQRSFNPSTLENLMCRSQISIGWDGTLYDCDFNQALGVTADDDFPGNIRDLTGKSIPYRKIVIGDHCFGCTAGAGSSCGGALVE